MIAVGCVALLSTWGPKPSATRRFEFGPPLSAGRVKPHLACDGNAVVMLAPDGSLWAWGGTRVPLRGVLPSNILSTKPLRVGTESDWQRVAVANSTVLAVKTNGTLWGWGYSHEGQLLAISKTTPLSPAQLGSDTDWADVHAGHGHVLALKRDGSLWAWGRNSHGAVGDGSGTNPVLVPTHISPSAKWKAVVGPAFNSFGIQTDGTLWGWGYDLLSGGKTNLFVPTLLDPATNWVSLAVGDFTMLAVKADGTLWVNGQNARPFTPGPGAISGLSMVQIGSDTDWREVVVGQSYFIARKANGTWWGSGNNSVGQLGLGWASDSMVPVPTVLPLHFDPWAFAAGTGNTTVLLGKDGTLWTWGVRAGEPQRMSVFDRIRHLWMRFTPGASFSYNPVFVHDTQPHFVWELPPSVKSTLGTNAPSQPKSAP